MFANMVGRLGGRGLGGIRQAATGSKPATTEFRRTMQASGTFTSTGVTFRAASYVTGDFNLATHYVVQAQEEATFGWGDDGHPDNQGYIFCRYQTTVPAAIDGPIRLQLEDAHGVPIAGGLVLEDDSTLLDGSQTDRRLMRPLPKWALWATEDSRLAIRINPTATATSTLADSTVQVPFTSRRTGQ